MATVDRANGEPSAFLALVDEVERRLAGGGSVDTCADAIDRLVRAFEGLCELQARRARPSYQALPGGDVPLRTAADDERAALRALGRAAQRSPRDRSECAHLVEAVRRQAEAQIHAEAERAEREARLVTQAAVAAAARARFTNAWPEEWLG